MIIGYNRVIFIYKNIIIKNTAAFVNKGIKPGNIIYLNII